MKLTDVFTYIKPAGKFRAYWTARIGQLTATGTTADEATKALTAKVEHAFTGSYAPVVIPHGNHVAYIWREPENGWCYCVRGQNFDGILDVNYVLAGDYAKTVRCARRHLADYVYDQVGTFPHPEEAAECIEDEEDRRDFISQCYRCF